jgi:hypothetical protein
MVPPQRERKVLERSVHAIAEHARHAYAVIYEIHEDGLPGDGPTMLAAKRLRTQLLTHEGDLERGPDRLGCRTTMTPGRLCSGVKCGRAFAGRQPRACLSPPSPGGQARQRGQERAGLGIGRRSDDLRDRLALTRPPEGASGPPPNPGRPGPRTQRR